MRYEQKGAGSDILLRVRLYAQTLYRVDPCRVGKLWRTHDDGVCGMGIAHHGVEPGRCRDDGTRVRRIEDKIATRNKDLARGRYDGGERHESSRKARKQLISSSWSFSETLLTQHCFDLQ